MKITVIGCGYVGLVTAACLGDFGHTVTGVDNDPAKIALLNQGTVPICEKNLTPLIIRNTQSKRLSFRTDLTAHIQDAEVIFIAVGTPSLPSGAADTRQVMKAAAEIAPYINEYKVIVNKSTVPIGAGEWVRKTIEERLKADVEFDVVSNPEFLREGNAVQDFKQPDRIVIGATSLRAQKVMEKVYAKLIAAGVPYLQTNLESAELIKYASNAFLATKITFINEIANLCEAANADINIVARGMGLDSRIGPQFLAAGPGYGGSCFPKDTRALVQLSQAYGEPVSIVETVVKANERQKDRMVRKIQAAIGGLHGKTLGVLGLAFKPETDDIRESPAITIIHQLLDAGALIKVHDPQAMREGERVFGNSIVYCENPYIAAADAEALVIVTDWNEYRQLDFKQLKKVMQKPLLIDLRNLFTPEYVQNNGFRYVGIGKGSAG